MLLTRYQSKFKVGEIEMESTSAKRVVGSPTSHQVADRDTPVSSSSHHSERFDDRLTSQVTPSGILFESPMLRLCDDQHDSR